MTPVLSSSTPNSSPGNSTAAARPKTVNDTPTDRVKSQRTAGAVPRARTSLAGLPKDNGSGPTVTVGTTAGAASTLLNPRTVSFDDLRLRVLGNQLVGFSGTWAGLAGTSPGNPTDGPGSSAWIKDRAGGTLCSFLRVEFEYDGQAFEIRASNAGGGRFRIMWDNFDGLGWQGEPSATWATRSVNGSNNVGSAYLHKVDFGSRATRRVRIDFGSAFFGGINIAGTESVWSPTYPKGPRMVVFGDSYIGGTVDGLGGGGSVWPADLGVIAAYYLGIQDVWLSGVGSTGYVSPGTTQNCAVQVTINGPATAGSWKLTCRVPGTSTYVDTATLAYNASNPTIQTALEAIYGVGNVSMSGAIPGGSVTFTLVGALAGKQVELPIFSQVTNLTGSTGFGCFIGASGGIRVKASDRIATDVVPYVGKGDIVLFGYGINDRDLTLSPYGGRNAVDAVAYFQAEVDKCVSAAVATGAFVACLGPWSPLENQASSDTNGLATVRLNNAIRNVAQKYGCVFIDNNAEPWIVGQGHVGGTTGLGNSDIYTGTDSTHPTEQGHLYYGRRIATALAPYMTNE